MKNVTPISRGRYPGASRAAAGGPDFLADYPAAGEIGRGPAEEAFLAGGAILSAGFYPTIISIFGGTVPLLAFLGIALAGLVWGLAWYGRPPGPPPSFFDAARPVAQAPAAPPVEDEAAEETRVRKAA